MSNFIKLAYGLNGDGTGTALEGKDIGQALADDKLAWVHLNANHPKTSSWISEELKHLDPFIISALTAEETRPRMTQVEQGAIVILRGVNLNAGEDIEDMVSIRLFIDKSRIISLEKRKVRAVLTIEDNLIIGQGPKHSGQFLCQLMGQLSGRFEKVLADLDELTDTAEEKVLSQADTNLRQEIIDIRKQSIMFRRHMAPQRDTVSQLRVANLSWLSEADKRELHENYNHLLRYVEELDAIRERAQIVKDELANIITDRLNKNTYVLSVIAAIFLPLGFLTGLLGINIGGIPGSNNPMAFMIFCGALVILILTQIIIFRKLKWF